MTKDQNLLASGLESDGTWGVINDGVMGGSSRSQIQRTEQGTWRFSGIVSLENNGGFASVRRDLGFYDLSASSGLEIRVRGDGRSYQLRLRAEHSSDGIAYGARFETIAKEWSTHRMPFGEFRPAFRGRMLDDVPLLDRSSIRQLAFLVADGKSGAFALEIDFVRPFRSARGEP